ncbi:MAG: histidine kinase [Sphingomonas bacterium]|jgi:signal transduction histidine kinase|nr:histidine kinase [Sphingomonas bacterium]
MARVSGGGVRFDDMLATVLARQPDRLTARVSQWRQILDLLAQRRLGADPEIGRDAIMRLDELRSDVPIAIRRESARSLAGRPVPAQLVAFLASDVPQVASDILGTVRLDEADWLAILPRLSPTGRGILRHRRDLPAPVSDALARFGSSDFALGVVPGLRIASITPEPTPVDPPIASDPWAELAEPALASGLPLAEIAPAPYEPGAGEGQIRAIISRIARFKKGRDGLIAPIGVPDEEHELFHFEAGPDGIIRWVEGVSRGPIVGETIAAPAAGAYGVDAQAPGAFRRRAAFRDARLLVAGSGSSGGEWRIAGVPIFAPADGRFLGYRGTGRRPRIDERAELAGQSAGAPTVGASYDGAAAGLAADSLRQLVHELRTPLNAIGGFAEMIRRQMRGPVSGVYRDRAQRIAEQASQLLAAVDDLDVAARLDSARLELQRVPVDVAMLLRAVCADHVDLLHARGAAITDDIAPGLPQALGDAGALRRMIARLVASSAALADVDEMIRATLGADPTGGLLLTVSRPARLAATTEAELLDPGYGPDGDWPDAPLLGLGFSLHLVRRLAVAAGGALVIDDARFLLHLPHAEETTDAGAGF